MFRAAFTPSLLLSGILLLGGVARGQGPALTWSDLLGPEKAAKVDQILRDDLKAARLPLERRINSLERWNEADKQAFEAMFGTRDDAAKDKVLQALKKADLIHMFLEKSLDLPPERRAYQFKPYKATKSDTIAAIFDHDDTSIYLTSEYFNLPGTRKVDAKSTKTRQGSLLHEMLHFAGMTDEGGHGLKTVQDLPIEKRLQNADAIRFYLEDARASGNRITGTAAPLAPPSSSPAPTENPRLTPEQRKQLGLPATDVPADSPRVQFDDSIEKGSRDRLGYDENATKSAADEKPIAKTTDSNKKSSKTSTVKKDSSKRASPQERLLESVKNRKTTEVKTKKDSAKKSAAKKSAPAKAKSKSAAKKSSDEGLIYRGPRIVNDNGAVRQPPTKPNYGPGTGRSGPEGQRGWVIRPAYQGDNRGYEPGVISPRQTGTRSPNYGPGTGRSGPEGQRLNVITPGYQGNNPGYTPGVISVRSPSGSASTPRITFDDNAPKASGRPGFGYDESRSKGPSTLWIDESASRTGPSRVPVYSPPKKGVRMPINVDPNLHKQADTSPALKRKILD